MDIGILASSTSSPSPLAVFPLDDPALDLSGIPFAGITASALSGDMAYFSIPERRWDK